MNRVIHGAVRRDLDRFLAALDAFRSGDRERAAQLLKAWVNFHDQLTRHHEGEHTIAWPALLEVGLAPELLATFDAEHEAMASALEQADAAMRTLARSAAGEDASSAFAAVTTLKAVTTTHLDHEETEVEPVYQRERESAPIKAMGKAFSREQGPVAGGRFFAWVLDGASVEERAAVTHEVPGPVLAILSGVLGRGYRKDVASVWSH